MIPLVLSPKPSVSPSPADDASAPAGYREVAVLDERGRVVSVRREYSPVNGRVADGWSVRFPGMRTTAFLGGLRRGLIRLGDIVAAVFGLALTLPLYPFLIPLVLWRSPGPVFYAARRQTAGGREFGCLKFRTMYADADKRLEELKAKALNQVDGPQFKMDNDPRVSPGGRILRALNLDELPQFWNVLFGDMSVVGPRPSPRKENQFCPAWREARLSVRPGITGLWQTRRTRRAGQDFQEWIKYDIEYVETMSPWLDLKIIWRTVSQIVRKGTHQ
jgi:lipopolysaccharide/colanic/teichoic acid biosynthesis glycosyltransferase